MAWTGTLGSWARQNWPQGSDIKLNYAKLYDGDTLKRNNVNLSAIKLLPDSQGQSVAVVIEKADSTAFNIDKIEIYGQHGTTVESTVPFATYTSDVDIEIQADNDFVYQVWCSFKLSGAPDVTINVDYSEGLVTVGTLEASIDDLDKYMVKGVDRVTAGQYTGVALGASATAEGMLNKSTGNASHAEGLSVESSGDQSHAEGCETIASDEYTHAEGYGSQATGSTAHAEGSETISSGYASHSEGYITTASGNYSHAEGYYSQANGNYVHAEGRDTFAVGTASHAEGISTRAEGDYSHAEGGNTQANCNYSSSAGQGTIANGKSQHVFGEYNIAERISGVAAKGAYIEIVGKGTSNNARSNARTLDWNGNEWLAGKLKVGGTSYADASEVAILASPAFTGTPTAPTPTNSSSSTQIATKEYVDQHSSGVFVATYQVTTYQEVADAFSSGKEVICIRTNGTTHSYCYQLQLVSPAIIKFCYWDGNFKNDLSLNSDDSWYTSQIRVQRERIETSVTLPSTNWNNNSQTVTVSKVTVNNLVQVSPAPTSSDDYVDAGILCTAQGNQTLTFTCKTVPANNVDVNIVIWN